MTYDLIVIGGGPAGYLGAERAGQKGLNTLLIEKRFLGGVCLNEGCIPSKTLLNSAKIYDKARFSQKKGVSAEKVNYDHQRVIKRKNKVVKTLVSGIKMQLKKNDVEVVNRLGIISGKDSNGYNVRAGDEIYCGKCLLIATGSKPLTPPISGLEEGLENDFVLTNREILDLEKIPEKLVIIGGGIIGLEMGSYFNSAGSNVTIIEMLNHIAGNTDREISEILLKKYEDRGIDFKLNSKVIKINDSSIVYDFNGQENEVEADKALLSIGRSPVVEDIGLSRIGVEVENGHIKVDKRGKTNISDVYAAGDVNGYSMLAHTAYREAEVCINNILGKKDSMSYRAIPAVIYTNPEVACVGETEATATKKGIDYECVNTSMMYSGRHVAETTDKSGICKILVAKKDKKLIGVHMIGKYTSEIIYGAAIMIENEFKVEDIKKVVFPHPTVSEVIREGIFQL